MSKTMQHETMGTRMAVIDDDEDDELLLTAPIG